MQSYQRDCKYCGERIWMLYHPEGRWLCLDVRDNRHNCRTSKPPAKENRVDKITGKTIRGKDYVELPYDPSPPWL